LTNVVCFSTIYKEFRTEFYIQNHLNPSLTIILSDGVLSQWAGGLDFLDARNRASDNRNRGKSVYKPTVPAVEQAARVLLCLGEGPSFKMSLTEICSHVGIYKSKGFSILNTLKQFGLVEKDPQTKAYSLGPSVIFLSRSVLDHLNFPEIVAPFLENLARDTNATAVFGLISGSHVLVVAKHEGNQKLGFGLGLGHRFHITLGAHGKAIAAFMSQAEREKLLAKKRLYFYGDVSRMDLNRLLDEMARCRSLGFADDIGEVTPGVNIISAPVFSNRERMLGCLILIGTFAAGKIEEYGPKVASSARQVSHRLGALMSFRH
jgi:DNA-binding IclR family transcriptional regulator